jgi:hypothetical protein
MSGDTVNRPMTNAERRAYNQRRHVRKRYEAALAEAGNPQTWIYVIGCDEVRLVKIGISSNVQSRLVAMQIGSPVVLRLLWTMPGSIDTEQDLHECFHAFRKHGEWFDFGDENPVAMVASASALLGHWQPTGLAKAQPRTFRPECSSEPSPVVDGEEVSQAAMPACVLLESHSEPVGLPPLPPGPRCAEAVPRVVLPPSFDAPESEAPADRPGEETS